MLLLSLPFLDSLNSNLFFFIHRCSRQMLPETNTQLCLFCSEGSGESVSVGAVFFFVLSVPKLSPTLPVIDSSVLVRLVAHLDKCTLRLLAENERVASFSPDLRARLAQAQDTSSVKVRLCAAAEFEHMHYYMLLTSHVVNMCSSCLLQCPLSSTQSPSSLPLITAQTLGATRPSTSLRNRGVSPHFLQDALIR